MILTERSEVEGESRRSRRSPSARASVALAAIPSSWPPVRLPARHAWPRLPVRSPRAERNVGIGQHSVLFAPPYGCEPDLDSVESGSLGSGAGGRRDFC